MAHTVRSGILAACFPDATQATTYLQCTVLYPSLAGRNMGAVDARPLLAAGCGRPNTVAWKV